MKHLIRYAAAASLLALGANASAHPDHHAESSAAQAESQEVKVYTAEQFYESTSLGLGTSGGHTFSPDGQYVLVNSDESGVFNAYLLPVAGGEPQPLTASTTNAIFASTFFPDDNRVIYTSDGGGDELNHVYVREVDGSVRDLTPGEGLTASFAGWSDDGETFYVASNQRDPQSFDLYAYSADDYSRELLFENPGGFIPAEMSDDGRWMVLVKANSSADSDLYLVDL